ncbi:MAG: tRNA (guanosine(37)-N1)-methyltransferase TrmD [Halobacteriovoraceae bacterium]|nr:tRNA (guanosine(37)-N1)-methyltransferase TrmD [Halobacteriovoraceae bacterium]|tara:strand:+ start:35528 stop:36271 length:744 start_codon:yes stop_codon:yes gene_type:complete
MKTKRIWILTLFPDYFAPLKEHGVLGSALRNERGGENGEFELNTVQIAEYSPKGYKGVDDSPFGGGQGMIMRADVLQKALLEGVVKKGGYKDVSELHVVCPAPRGKTLDNSFAIDFASRVLDFSAAQDVVFLCGRYEGIDERFLEKYVDEYVSLGDFILTGGELAVMCILDASMRFVPGVVGNKLSVEDESFSQGMLEHALYTRPREFEGQSIPEEYISGDHKRIDARKKKSSLEITKKYRPDLLEK